MTRIIDEMSDLEPCPDDEVLRLWAEGRVTDPAVQSILSCHAQLCESCRRKLADLRRNDTQERETVAQYADELRKHEAELKKSRGAGPVPGTIWRTTPRAETDAFGPLVMVIDGPTQISGGLVKVAEVSEDIPQAIQTDAVLEPPESGLGFRCMVRAANVFILSPEKLTSFAGRLPESLANKITEFCREGEHFDDRVPLTQFVFLQDSQGNRFMWRKGITTGLMVTQDDDPRLESMSASKINSAYLTDDSRVTAKTIRPPRFRATDPMWFAKRILPLAAGLVLVVIGIHFFKPFYNEETEKPPQMVLGTGMASLPLANRIVLKDKASLSGTREVGVFFDRPVDVGSVGNLVLLKRVTSKIQKEPILYLTAAGPLPGGISLALYNTDSLNAEDGRKQAWSCNSLLIPQPGRYDMEIYEVSLQSLIALATREDPSSAATSFSEAVSSWVMTYLERERSWYASRLVENFRQRHPDLYQDLFPVESDFYPDQDESEKQIRLLGAIAARYPEQAALMVDPGGEWVRILMTCLITMESFSQLDSPSSVGTIANVDKMYQMASNRFKLPLEKVLGDRFGEYRKEVERKMALRISVHKVLDRPADVESWPTLTFP
jgi:hypothetical protein